MNPELLIDGKDVHAFLYIDGEPFEVVCATDCVFEVERELIGATTPDSGQYYEVRKRLKRFTMTITGATTSDNDNNVSVFEFIDDDSTSEPLDMSIVYTNRAGTQRTIRANWYAERTSISSPADASSQFELILRGTGSYTHSDLTAPVSGNVDNITSDSFTLTGGVISDPGLNGVTIIGVWQEGSNMESMGISYTHVGQVVTPDATYAIEGQRYFIIWTF